MKSSRKKFFSIVILLLVCMLTGCMQEIGGPPGGRYIIDDKTFIDDVGNKIELPNYIESIVSMDRVHTENLFAIGAEDKLIGVDTKSIYPAKVNQLPHYNVNKVYDLELIINEKPDVVLVSPQMNQLYPSFISMLEVNDILVVSLMPKSLDKFDEYIEKLGLITGEEENAELQLNQYHASLDKIQQMSDETLELVDEPVKVFVETSENGYYTPTTTSLIGQAVEIAGGETIVENPSAPLKYEVEKYYGKEKLIKHSQDIDVYVTIQGKSQSGGNLVSISQNEMFKDFKSFKENKIFEIDYSVVGEYTFRYPKGVWELYKMFYPEYAKIYGYYDKDVESYDLETPLTRSLFAELIYRYENMPMVVISKSDYYDFEKYNHAYGRFSDVSWNDDDFDAIEAVVMKMYLKPLEKKEDGSEIFGGNEYMTREDIARFIYIKENNLEKKGHYMVDDIEHCDEKVAIQKVVDAGLMKIDKDHNFHPHQIYTVGELFSLMRWSE